MQSLSALDAINCGYAVVEASSPAIEYAVVEASSPAIEAAWRVPAEPRAVTVVQMKHDGTHTILADVSAHRMWRRDYVATADAMTTLLSLSFAACVDGYRMSA
jgi:hypothetical protein